MHHLALFAVNRPCPWLALQCSANHYRRTLRRSTHAPSQMACGRFVAVLLSATWLALKRCHLTGFIYKHHSHTFVICRVAAFDLFDTDGSGTIDAKELKVAMRCVQRS